MQFCNLLSPGLTGEQKEPKEMLIVAKSAKQRGWTGRMQPDKKGGRDDATKRQCMCNNELSRSSESWARRTRGSGGHRIVEKFGATFWDSKNSQNL